MYLSRFCLTDLNFEAHVYETSTDCNAGWAGKPVQISALRDFKTKWKWSYEQASADLVADVVSSFFIYKFLFYWCETLDDSILRSQNLSHTTCLRPRAPLVPVKVVDALATN